jgi:dipeptidyl aminopeptidase/acylaminoacyl peptidase
VPDVAAYGSWSSPIAAEQLARSGVRLSEPWPLADGAVLWLEGRPAEDGRTVLVRGEPDGSVADLVPAGFDVRTRVHEYGGGAWLLAGDVPVCSHWDDQRLYRITGDGPEPITPAPAEPAALRYADGRATPDGRLIVCVRESHAGADVVNELVVLPADGSAAPRVISGGCDFAAFPRISPDGSRLAWTQWDHPQMPWDGTELMVAPLAADGSLGAAVRVAGGPEESIWQPEFAPDGTLHYVSDRTGWWNLYREDGAALAPDAAEYGYPQWLFGGSTYAFAADGSLWAIRGSGGEMRLCRIAGGRAEPLDLPFTSYEFPALRADGGRLVFKAAGPAHPPVLAALDTASGDLRVLRHSSSDVPGPGYIPVPRAVEFASDGGGTAHAWYYPPTNPEFTGPPDERPPLIVHSHGGPTSQESPAYQGAIAYWTSRGFGVADVNYSGSTGYGREYRNRLRGRWGELDTADCAAAARHLAETGAVDGARLAISGESAGGYATLCALVFRDEFAVGASHYGVGDAEALARDTHKFESRYLDGLIGPYPEMAERYRERSPIHAVERLRVPVILFQGLEDKVVPPEQAETMVAALRANRIPFAYLAFAGEQHGFRRAATIVRAYEAELAFYGRILGFTPAGGIEVPEIENLDALPAP